MQRGHKGDFLYRIIASNLLKDEVYRVSTSLPCFNDLLGLGTNATCGTAATTALQYDSISKRASEIIFESISLPASLEIVYSCERGGTLL